MGRMPNSHSEERAHHADLGLTAVAMLEEIVGRREVEASGSRRRSKFLRLRKVMLLFGAVVLVEVAAFPEVRLPRRHWAHDSNPLGRCVGD